VWGLGRQEHTAPRRPPIWTLYVYRAALLCEDCASPKMYCLEYVNMVMGGRWPLPGWQDSTCYPQGPYSNGGGEADSPQHCDACGVFLETP